MHQHGGAANLHPMKQAQPEAYQIRKVLCMACLSEEGRQAEHRSAEMGRIELVLEPTSDKVSGRRDKICSPDEDREDSISMVAILAAGTA